MNRTFFASENASVQLIGGRPDEGRIRLAKLRDASSQIRVLGAKLEAAVDILDATVGSIEIKFAEGPAEIAKRIRTVLANRRTRDKYFDALLFADPAWDILLDMTAAKLEGRQVSVSSLTMAAAVPTTTGLRWVKSLVDSGLIVRVRDPSDQRRSNVTIDDKTFVQMLSYLERVNYFIA